MSDMMSGYEDDPLRHLVVLVTTKDQEEALKIARQIVSERLCACVNVVNAITSVFIWKGNVEQAAECLMIIKTHADVFNTLLDRIKDLHSYDVPEIIALPIMAGNPSYLNWIDEVTGGVVSD